MPTVAPQRYEAGNGDFAATLLEQLGCDCCSSLLNVEARERGIFSGPAEINNHENIPVVDYDDGPLGMYAPPMPRAAMERASASSVSRSATGMSTKSSYSIVLHRADGEKLGLNVDFKPDRQSLPIVGIAGGMAERWNMQNPEQQFIEGDSIIEVNGTSQDPSAMVQLCQSSAELRLTLVRGNGQPPQPARPAARASDCLACRSFGKGEDGIDKPSAWIWFLRGGACASK